MSIKEVELKTDLQNAKEEIARLNGELADYRAELKHANRKIDELEGLQIRERNEWANDLKVLNSELKEQTKRLKDREGELENVYDDYRKATELLSAHKRLEAPTEPSYVDVNQLKRKLLEAIDEIF